MEVKARRILSRIDAPQPTGHSIEPEGAPVDPALEG
jgi:hypothetical protein